MQHVHILRSLKLTLFERENFMSMETKFKNKGIKLVIWTEFIIDFQRTPHIDKPDETILEALPRFVLGQQHRLVRRRNVPPSKLPSRNTLLSLMFYKTKMHARALR